MQNETASGAIAVEMDFALLFFCNLVKGLFFWGALGDSVVAVIYVQRWLKKQPIVFRDDDQIVIKWRVMYEYI